MRTVPMKGARFPKRRIFNLFAGKVQH